MLASAKGDDVWLLMSVGVDGLGEQKRGMVFGEYEGTVFGV